ncbi:MAG TPA: thioesterase family protein [Anaerolineales bacterium]
MDLIQILRPGMQREETFRVEEEHAAIHIGSGSSRVLATPWMIAFMERVSHRLVSENLPQGYSSVGVVVDVRHLAPTPIGGTVRVRAEIIELNGLNVALVVQAWDESELVGEGRHQRVVIDEARFLKRVEAKKPAGE